MAIVSAVQPRRPSPPPAAVFPAPPTALRGVFSGLRSRQARPAPAWPQAHRPVGEAPDVTGYRGISWFEHFPGQLVVVRVPPPPSGVGATARHHRARPRGAELTARGITFSGLRPRAAAGWPVSHCGPCRLCGCRCCLGVLFGQVSQFFGCFFAQNAIE
jgi:hypothetical protein